MSGEEEAPRRTAAHSSPHDRRSHSPRRRSRSRSRSPARESSGWRAHLERLIADGAIGRTELEDVVIAELEALKPADADACLERFAESNLSKITNKQSFLLGIVRRVKEEGGSSDLVSVLLQLPRPIRKALEALMDSGRLRRGDLESRVAFQLRDLPTSEALAAIDRYGAARLESIRSKTGFFVGILRRIAEESRGGYQGGAPYGRGGGGYQPMYMHPPGYGAPPPYGGGYGGYPGYQDPRYQDPRGGHRR